MAEKSKRKSLILETLSGMRLDIEFPTDITAREVADDIANQLEYPVADEDTDELIVYYLTDGKGNRIDDDMTLAAAGLSDGDTVKIQSTSKNLAPPPTPPTTTPPPDGQIGLWIKLLIQLRNVYEEFDVNITVSDLLAQMIAKYDLPAYYPSSSEPIIYVVSSKEQGRQLFGVETLRETGIKPMDVLYINSDNKAGGGGPPYQVSLRPVGLRLDEVTDIEIPTLMSNEPALRMTLHAFKDTLRQLEETRRELQEAEGKIEQLNDRLKGSNIATALFLVGQIEIGFGTNLITNNSSGGWFVFLTGLALNLGALYFSFFGVNNSSRT